jgi:hypothetical protein
MTLHEKHFQRTAVHAAHMAKGHHAIVATTRKALGMKKGAKADLGELDVEDLVEALEEVMEHLSEMGDAWGDYTEHCTECAKTEAEASADAAEKAAADRLNLKREDIVPLPEGLTKLAPTHFAVARNGQPPIAEAADAIRDLQIRKTIGLDESDQHSEELSIERR